MPEAYMLTNPVKYGSTRYTVPDEAQYEIPRLLCPGCGEDGLVWFRYPEIDPSAFGEDILGRLWSYDPLAPYGETHRGPDELPPEDMRELLALLAPIMGPDRPYGPTTEFGPARGPAEGMFDDFSWSWPSGPVFLRQSVFDALGEAGFPVTGVAPDARYRRKRRDPLIEPIAPPTVHVHPSTRLEPCATCGYVTGLPEGGRLDPETWDDRIPFQRVYENPRVIVVNAALAGYIRERQYTGVTLVEMKFE